MKNEQFLENVLTAANVMSLVEQTINKIGLEYLAPIDEAIKNEKMSKLINTAIGRDEDE